MYNLRGSNFFNMFSNNSGETSNQHQILFFYYLVQNNAYIMFTLEFAGFVSKILKL